MCVCVCHQCSAHAQLHVHSCVRACIPSDPVCTCGPHRCAIQFCRRVTNLRRRCSIAVVLRAHLRSARMRTFVPDCHVPAFNYTMYINAIITAYVIAVRVLALPGQSFQCARARAFFKRSKRSRTRPRCATQIAARIRARTCDRPDAHETRQHHLSVCVLCDAIDTRRCD